MKWLFVFLVLVVLVVIGFFVYPYFYLVENQNILDQNLDQNQPSDSALIEDEIKDTNDDIVVNIDSNDSNSDTSPEQVIDQDEEIFYNDDAGRGNTKSYLEDNFVDLSNVSENCVELIPGHNNMNKNRINIVYVGIDYENKNNFYALIKSTFAYDKNPYSLLKLEPWTSNKSKFNFFFVNEIGNVTSRIVRENRGSEAVSEINRLVDLCDADDPEIIALINWSFGSGNFGKMTRISYLENSNLVEMASKVINHELGHLIFVLEDEYISNDRRDRLYAPGEGKLKGTCYYMPNAEINCALQNNKYVCSTTDNVIAECQESSPWRDLIGNGCGKDGVIDCDESDPNYYNEVGCYLGCKFPNLFMPERKSIMHGDADYGYGLYETRRICNVIKKRTGSTSGICNTLCLDGCELGEQCINGTCIKD